MNVLEAWVQDWLEDRIPGDKLTVIWVEKNQMAGIVQFWSTPHVQDQRYLEGRF